MILYDKLDQISEACEICCVAKTSGWVWILNCSNFWATLNWVECVFGKLFTVLTLVATLEIFFRVFLNKHKLHNLIKRKFYILTTTTIKNKQIHKVYNCLLWVFIFWNRCMIVSLSILQATYFSTYTTQLHSKLLFNCFINLFVFYKL